MQRPNYVSIFNRISQKLCDKNELLLDKFAEGESQLSKMATYSPFVAIRTINNLADENTDTKSMNINLDYLLQKWDY
jgi:hypothetical protein